MLVAMLCTLSDPLSPLQYDAPWLVPLHPEPPYNVAELTELAHFSVAPQAQPLHVRVSLIPWAITLGFE